VKPNNALERTRKRREVNIFAPFSLRAAQCERYAS
jgi:hypothetical protein